MMVVEIVAPPYLRALKMQWQCQWAGVHSSDRWGHTCVGRDHGRADGCGKGDIGKGEEGKGEQRVGRGREQGRAAHGE